MRLVLLKHVFFNHLFKCQFLEPRHEILVGDHVPGNRGSGTYWR